MRNCAPQRQQWHLGLELTALESSSARWPSPCLRPLVQHPRQSPYSLLHCMWQCEMTLASADCSTDILGVSMKEFALRICMRKPADIADALHIKNSLHGLQYRCYICPCHFWDVTDLQQQCGWQLPRQGTPVTGPRSCVRRQTRCHSSADGSASTQFLQSDCNAIMSEAHHDVSRCHHVPSASECPTNQRHGCNHATPCE